MALDHGPPRATLRNQDARDPAAAKKQILDAFAESDPPRTISRLPGTQAES